MAGSGQIEFAEFVILASKFIVEEDEEALQKELKEAFRLYDKEGQENKAYAYRNVFLFQTNCLFNKLDIPKVTLTSLIGTS